MPNFDGQEVGKISIKVVPDLDGFRSELRRKLAEIEKTERGKVTVDVDADTRGVREKIEAAAKDTTAHVDVDVDSTALDRFQRRLLGEMSSILTRMEPKIRLDVDGEHLRRKMNKQFAKIGKTIRAKIPVEPELAAAARAKAMAEVTAFKEGLEKRLNPVEFKIKPEFQTFDALAKQRAAETVKRIELEDKIAQKVREVNERTAREEIQHARDVFETRERHAKMLQGIEDRHARTRYKNDLDLLRKQTAEASRLANDMELEVKSRLDKDDLAETLAEARALASRAGVKLDVDIKDTAAEAKLAETIAKLKALAAMSDVKIKVDIDRDVVKRSFAAAAYEGIRSFGRGLKNNISLLSDDTMLIAAAVLALGAPLVGTLTAAIAGLPALLAGILTPIGAVVLGLDGITKAAQPVVDAFGRMSEAISGKFEKSLTPVFEKLTNLEPLLTRGFSRVADSISGIFTRLGDSLTSEGNSESFTRIFDNVARGLDAMSPGITSFFDTLVKMTDKGAEHLKGLGDWFSGLMDRIGQALDSVISSGAFDKAISGLKPVLEGLANGIGNIFSTAFDWFSNPANSERTGHFLEQLGSLVKGALKVSEVVFPILERLGTYLGDLVDQFSTSGELDFSRLIGQIGTDIKNSAEWGDIGKEIGKMILKGIGEGLMSIPGTLLNPAWWIGKILGRGDDGDKAGTAMVDRLVPRTVSPELAARADENARKFSESLAASGASQIEAFTQSLTTTNANVGSDPLRNLLGGEATTQSIMDGFKSSLDAAVPQVQQQVESAKKQLVQAAQQVPAGTGIDGGVGGASVTQQVQQNTEQLKQTVASGLSGLKQTAAEKFTEVVDAAQEAIDKIIPKFAELPSRIVDALGDLSGTLKPAGEQLMAGLKAGLESGFQKVLSRVKEMAAEIKANKGPLPYDRQVLVENGMALMEGLGTGLEQGFQGVLEKAQGLASRIAEAMESGAIKTDLGAFSKEYQRQMDAIKLQRQQLQIQLEGTTDKGEKKALREQLKQLSTVQQTLTAQSQQLKLTDRYGGALDHTNNTMGEMLSKMTQMAQQFGQANAKQAMSDLGISGNGAIPKLADIGIGYMGQMLGSLFSQGMNGGVNIQVNSVDEALAARQNIVNKQALRYDRR